MAKNDNIIDFLGDVADAIREKKGISEPIAAQNFADEIKDIKAGGAPDLENFYMTWILDYNKIIGSENNLHAATAVTKSYNNHPCIIEKVTGINGANTTAGTYTCINPFYIINNGEMERVNTIEVFSRLNTADYATYNDCILHTNTHSYNISDEPGGVFFV